MGRGEGPGQGNRGGQHLRNGFARQPGELPGVGGQNDPAGRPVQKADTQGIMMHICTEEWDRGAALTYCGFPIRGGDYDALWDQMERKLSTKTLDQIKAEEGQDEPLFKRIREDGAKRELPLIVSTIRLFADGKVCIRDKRLWCDGKKLDGPYDLSAEVDKAI